MSLNIIHSGQVITACLDGEIDHHTAAGIRNQIDQAVVENHPTMLVLDFKNVSFFQIEKETSIMFFLLPSFLFSFIFS